jgi:hypothetical protein
MAFAMVVASPPKRKGDTVSSPLFIAFMIALVLVYRLAASVTRGDYACPGCGARSANRHAADCSWSR